MRGLLAIWGVLFLFLGGAVWASTSCFNGGCHKPSAFRGPVEHGPVKGDRCEECHYPHVSRYPHLLKAQVPALCFKCHTSLQKSLRTASWVHLPVKKGACGRCHRPHAGGKGLLLSRGAKLCFSCHEGLKKPGYKFSHAPFRQGRCLACHRPHLGQTRDLLRDQGSRLCFRCHAAEQTVRAHGKYARQGMDCLTCHNPHGSNRPHLVRAFLHEPYREKACKECHGGKAPRGPEMCFACHRERRKDFLKVHTHYLPSDDRPFCVDCHSPHASDDRRLLLASPDWLCIRCHREALVQKRQSLYVHPAWGKCMDCHEGHGSSFGGMLKGDANAVCVRCHKTQGKFTHPIGEKVKDPRNGQSLTCVTCHDPMGTQFKYELRLSGEASLCLECHKGY
ncbi:MAG TPA: hypothetical protein ENJ40_07995 [Thermosulfurimonas dismutans]|uniref:Doubled CXXCH motif domain-containing protein n=1 Tax=Thermosulfurimonas dismutans TaxID=999894 RepID=A0A7C3GFF2_9BACT|nr:hypothetical protein [Thermosulfurimonas dismutans]